jgi:DNA processing protein
MKATSAFSIAPDELIHQIALLKVEGVGPVVAKNLVAYCGSARAVFSKPKGWLRKVPEVGPKLAESLSKPALLKEAEAELTFCREQGVEVLHYLSPNYPDYLKTIYDAPLILFQKGPLNLNAQPAIAIVGTRKATAYGRKWTEAFAAAFASAGINVVSGLAYGIDIEAHKAALEAGGTTTAVLAHGLDRVYPSQHTPYADAIATSGALVSEYFIGTQPKANHFPQRNRILSGMSRAVIVVEAAEKGGAVLLARIAFEQNREVYAVPGSLDWPFSKGCNQLIRELVAKLATSATEVMEDLGLPLQDVEDSLNGSKLTKGTQMRVFKEVVEPLSADEQKVLNQLSEVPVATDSIAERTGLGIADLMPALLGLEFKGLVAQQPGWKYVRK